MTGFANLDVFLENFRKGGGAISDPKNYIADFLVSKRYILVVNFGQNVQKGGRGVWSKDYNITKGGGVLPKDYNIT